MPREWIDAEEVYADNPTVGVRKTRSGRWQASITIGSRLMSLGRFDNKEDAIEARREAEEK